MIGGLSRQILSKGTDIPERITDIYESAKIDELELSIAKTIFLTACLEYSKVYLVLDALDECEDRYRKPALKFMSSLNGRVDVRILVTSRYHSVDIQSGFEGSPQLRIEAQNADLRQYLSQRIDDDPAAAMIEDSSRLQIIERIVSNARGLFLLPALQIQAVLDAPTVGEMEEALESLPSALFEVFDNTLAQILSLPGSRKQLGMKSLMWILNAKTDRFLRAIDLRTALAIRPGQSATDGRLKPSTEMIVACCKGLVTVDKATTQLRFVHQAVRDYLHTLQAELFPNSQDLLTGSCLEYLTTEPLVENCSRDGEELQKKIIDTLFLWYAASCWGFHARNARNESTFVRILEFLDSHNRRSCAVQIWQYLRGRRQFYWSCEESQSHNRLHVAALFGLEQVTIKLLDTGNTDIDATTSIGTTALMNACSEGYAQVHKAAVRERSGSREAELEWHKPSCRR